MILFNSNYSRIRIAYAIEAHVLWNLTESLIRIYECHGNRAIVVISEHPQRDKSDKKKSVLL